MFADVLLPIAVALIMGSLGLTLVTDDFRRIVTAPRGVGIGLANLLSFCLFRHWELNGYSPRYLAPSALLFALSGSAA